jgi:hypothetical protein
MTIPPTWIWARAEPVHWVQRRLRWRRITGRKLIVETIMFLTLDEADGVSAVDQLHLTAGVYYVSLDPIAL